MIKKLTLGAAALGLLAMGCAVENETYNLEESNDRFTQNEQTEQEFDEFNFDRPDNGTLRVTNGALFTNTAGFNVNGPASVDSYGDSGYLDATLVRTEADSAMAILYISNLDHPAFTEVGRTTTFSYGEMVGESEGGAATLSVVGCVGPDEGNWEIDEEAGEVEVEVEETPEGDRVLVLSSDLITTELQIAD